MDLNKFVVFYDGDCGFCNHWVEWILKNDKKNLFQFSALQSNFGQNFLKERGLKTKTFDTIYLWKPKFYYLKKSEAIVEIGKNMGGKYFWLPLLGFVPTIIGDKVYDFVAKRRHRLKKNTCYMPTPEERKKFIS